MADDPLKAMVRRMVERGDTEDAIAEVIRNYEAAQQPPSSTSALDRIEGRLREGGFGSVVEGMRGGGVGSGSIVKVGEQYLGLGEKVARRIYSGLLKPKQGLKDSFGGAQALAGTLLNERAPITSGGFAKVTSRLGQSRDAAMQMVKAAEQQGMQGVVAKDVVKEFAPVVTELRKRIDIGQANALPQVGARGRAILRTTGRTGGDIPLTRAQALKETAQDAASGAYRALERGSQKQLSADDLLDQAVAKGLRKGIERKVPGVDLQNARTQSLIGGKNALEDAIERNSNTLGVGGAKDALAMIVGGGAYAAGAGPMSVPIAMGTRMMTTPSTGSMAAILLNEASKKGVLDASTRAAILATLGQRSNQQ